MTSRTELSTKQTDRLVKRLGELLEQYLNGRPIDGLCSYIHRWDTRFSQAFPVDHDEPSGHELMQNLLWLVFVEAREICVRVGAQLESEEKGRIMLAQWL